MYISWPMLSACVDDSACSLFLARDRRVGFGCAVASLAHRAPAGQWRFLRRPTMQAGFEHAGAHAGEVPPVAGLTGGGIFATHQHGFQWLPSEGSAGGARKPWSTGDAALDSWLTATFSAPHVLNGLAQVCPSERREIATSCKRKGAEVRNAEAYIMGCIRKSLAHPKPYGSAAATAPSAFQSDDAQHLAVVRAARPLHPTSAVSIPTAAPGLNGGLGSASNGAIGTTVPQVKAPVPAQPVQHESLPVVPLYQPARGKIPDWVREAASNLSSKSKVLSAVYKQLDAALVSQLSRLPPALQYLVCSAILLQAADSANVQTVASKCVHVCHELGLHVQAPSPGVQASKEPTKLVIVCMGAFLGLGQVALKAACMFVTSESSDLHLHVVEMHCFAIDAVATNIEKTTADALNVRVQVWDGLSHAVTVIKDRKAFWKGQGAKVLVLHAVSCADPGSVYSCGPDYNVTVTQSTPSGLWLHLRAMKMLATEFDSGLIAQCIWTDRVLIANGQLDPEAWFGHRCHLDAANYKPVEALGCLYMAPKPVGPITGRCRQWKPADALNGMVWGPARDPNAASERQPLVLSKRIMDVPEKKLFDEADMSATDKHLLCLAQCVEVSTGKIRLMKPELIMALLGMHDTPLPAALLSAFPCYEYILAASGNRIDKCELQGEPCGFSRWCASCEECLRQAFRAPHPGMLTDHVSAWVGRTLRAWTGLSPDGSLDLPDLMKYPDC